MSRLTQRKGDIATTQAVATFTRLGFDVSIPVTESASYDLIVDDAVNRQRVQVKFSSSKNKVVDLRNISSNSKGYNVKKTIEDAYDWLYVFTGFSEHLFKECLVGRSGISLNANNVMPGSLFFWQ